MKDFATIKSVMEGHREELFSYKGVHSAGIGYSKKDGNKGAYAILVYIDTDKSVDAYLKAEKMPQEIDSIPVELIVAPKVSYLILPEDQAGAENDDFGKYRPLVGGIQMFLKNNIGGWFGTLGTFVQSIDESDDNLYILSNLHVLDEVGRTVHQPLNGVKTIIGSTSTATTYKDADAALAQVNDPSDVLVNIIQDIGEVKETYPITSAALGKRVLKRGRTTGLTEGTIEAINVDIRISETVSYTDCVIVRSDAGTIFGGQGDSGSPTVIREEQKLAGLLFASDLKKGGTCCFCTIDNVFKNLKVKLPE